MSKELAKTYDPVSYTHLDVYKRQKGIRSEERAFMVDFFSTSIIYYLLDFITSNKNMTTEERSKQIAVAVRTLGKFKFSNGMSAAKA